MFIGKCTVETDFDSKNDILDHFDIFDLSVFDSAEFQLSF